MKEETIEKTIQVLAETLERYRIFMFRIEEERQDIQYDQKLLQKLIREMKKK